MRLDKSPLLVPALGPFAHLGGLTPPIPIIFLGHASL